MRALFPLFACCILLDQQPQAIRVNSQLVEINVVALRAGQPVDDLTKDDFEILDNGKPQEILFFSLEAKNERPASPAFLPENVFSNKVLGKVATAPGVSVVLFDLLNTAFADQASARLQLLNLMHKMQPGERIGVYVLGREVSVLHDFTDDPRQLAAVLAHFEGRPFPRIAAVGEASKNVDVGGSFAEAERLLKRGENVQRDYFNVDRATITLNALRDISRHLARQPGRKSLVWISGSFPFTLGATQQDFDELARDSPNRERGSFQAIFDSTMRAVSDANMAIYPVDARGLIPSSIYDAGNAADSAGGYSRADEPNRPLYRPPNLDSMENLANKSGGRAFFNTNDLQQSIRAALADNRVAYTLAFSPASAPDDKFHALKVIVRRKDINLLYRQGYIAASRSLRPSDPRAILEDAVASPLEALAIGITVRTEGPKSADGVWHLVTIVDSGDLAIAEHSGKWVGHLQVLYSVQAETGRELGGTLDDVNLDLKPEVWTRVAADGLPMRKELQAPQNAFKVRIAVYDVSTGRLGSVSIPLRKVPRGE